MVFVAFWPFLSASPLVARQALAAQQPHSGLPGPVLHGTELQGVEPSIVHRPEHVALPASLVT